MGGKKEQMRMGTCESREDLENNVASLLQLFEKHVRKGCPQLAASAVNAKPDAFGNITLIEAPWPPEPERCSVSVIYRGDCFEVAFSVAETRGPAEQQFVIGDDVSEAVAATIDFLRAVLSRRVVIDIFRYRFLWFQPYYLAFFREASVPPKARVTETLTWTGNSMAGRL